MLGVRVLVKIILQSLNAVVKRTCGGFALQFGVVEKGLFFDSRIEIIFGGLLETLRRKGALGRFHVTVSDEEITLLGHLVWVFVVSSTGEICDGIVIFQHTIVGKTFREPIVTVKC